MATPLKPWEKVAGSNSRSPGMMESGGRSGQPMKPAIPPRPNSSGIGSSPYTNRVYSPSYGTGYGMYGGGMGGYGYGIGYRPPYNMYSGYGGYGQYGQEESDVVRQAEERTRMAFQSVESVVGAFASVTMMLESTYFAVHSCFRAILAVAGHFSRLKNHLLGILSAISFLQRLRRWLRWVLSILRLREYTPTEQAWEVVSRQFPSSSASPIHQDSAQRIWPVVMFFTVVFGVPWLLWRILSSIVSESEEVSRKSWEQADSSTSNVARALYSFTAERSDELTIAPGDELTVAPRELQPNSTGWLLVQKDNRRGLVPTNHVEFLPRSSSSSPSSSHEPCLERTQSRSSMREKTPSPSNLTSTND